MPGLLDFDPDKMKLPTPTPVGQINAGMQPANVSLLTRLKAGLGDAARNAGNIVFAEPKGLDGLLSPEDLADARKQGLLDLGMSLLGDQSPSFGEALAHGVQAGQAGFRGNLNDKIQNSVYAQGVQQQKSLLDARARIAKEFQAPPGETFQQAQERLMKMYTAYVNAGDTEMAGKLSEVVKGIKETQPKPVNVPEGGSLVGPDGKVIYHNPKPPAVDHSGQQQANRDRIQQNLIVSDFEKATKDFSKIEEAYNAVQASVANPNNPYGTMAALEGMARMLNPGVSVRAATLKMLKDYGSLGDKAERFYEVAKSGAWPKGMRENIYQIAESAMAGAGAEFDNRRLESIQRGRIQGVDVSGLLHRRHGGRGEEKTGAKSSSTKGNAATVRGFLP